MISTFAAFVSANNVLPSLSTASPRTNSRLVIGLVQNVQRELITALVPLRDPELVLRLQ